MSSVTILDIDNDTIDQMNPRNADSDKKKRHAKMTHMFDSKADRKRIWKMQKKGNNSKDLKHPDQPEKQDSKVHDSIENVSTLSKNKMNGVLSQPILSPSLEVGMLKAWTTNQSSSLVSPSLNSDLQ